MVEEEWLAIVFVGNDIFALRRADFVVIYFVIFVCVTEFFSGFGPGVCAVVKTVVFPCRVGELGPLYMVGQELFSSGVHNVNFGPVGA